MKGLEPFHSVGIFARLGCRTNRVGQLTKPLVAVIPGLRRFGDSLEQICAVRVQLRRLLRCASARLLVKLLQFGEKRLHFGVLAADRALSNITRRTQRSPKEDSRLDKLQLVAGGLLWHLDQPPNVADADHRIVSGRG